MILIFLIAQSSIGCLSSLQLRAIELNNLITVKSKECLSLAIVLTPIYVEYTSDTVMCLH